MPSAAPGVTARGMLRQISPGNPWVSAHNLGRPQAGYSHCPGMQACSGLVERRLRRWFYFTRQLSVIGVECGRLGEVESLVGDCRPPPPGNPRRPSSSRDCDSLGGGLDKDPVKNCGESIFYVPMWQENGGVFLPMWEHSTLNIIKKHRNLNKLNKSQYFKNIRSFFTCTEHTSVLEFEHFHYHLYGVWLVEPLSIAITNVLTT